MLDSKPFWRVVDLAVLVFWLAVAALLYTGQREHPLVLIGAIFIVAHVLELPLAYRLLRGRGFPAAKVFVMTMVFGFTWWLPAQRGVYLP